MFRSKKYTIVICFILVLILLTSVLSGCSDNTTKNSNSVSSTVTASASASTSATAATSASAGATKTAAVKTSTPVPTAVGTKEVTTTPSPDQVSNTKLPIGSLPQFAQEERPYSANVLVVPSVNKETSYDVSAEITAITYQGADYKGHVTRVFAFIGIPKTASKTNKCPAVVLVHGGGGTADAYWVKYWVDRGYAAISMDLEGHYPVNKGNSYAPGTTTNQYSGPIRNGAFADASMRDISLQWPYQAVSDIMIARTLLGSMEQVNSKAIGIMGFSWGGYLTSFTIGVDNRFAFAVPVYGSAYLSEMYTYFGTATRGKAAKWEPSLNIKNITAKTLWFNSDKDPHFSVNGTSLSYENAAKSVMIIDPYLTHGGGNCWTRPEQFIFADSVTKGTAGLLEITQQPSGLNPTVKYSIPNGVSVNSAKVFYRSSEMGWKDTKNDSWLILDCKVDEANKTVSCTLPAGTVAYYINIYDNRVDRDLFMNKNERIGTSTKVVYFK